MAAQDTIWVVVNAEDTEEKATPKNARGCRILCEARIAANADMLYAWLVVPANLVSGSRIVMHQGGARPLGGQVLRAFGYFKEGPRPLTADDARRFPGLWAATSVWYKFWPSSPLNLSGEQIVFYKLWEPAQPWPSPSHIRPMPGNKFIDLHPNCVLHRRCAAYPEIDRLWRNVCGSRSLEDC